MFHVGTSHILDRNIYITIGHQYEEWVALQVG